MKVGIFIQRFTAAMIIRSIISDYEFFYCVGEFLIHFQDVAFQPSRSTFRHFSKIALDVKALEPTHVTWLGVGNRMVPIKYFPSNIFSYSVR